MEFWEMTNSEQLCNPCKVKQLKEWGTGPGSKALSEDERVTPDMFTSLGSTPWADNDPGERFFQCDGCLGQWGPDS